jgi:hypothetical protein
MTVTGNAKLATVDFTGWAGLGTSTTVDPSIAVYSNALVATKAKILMTVLLNILLMVQMMLMT